MTNIFLTPLTLGRLGTPLLSNILYIVCSDRTPVSFIISLIAIPCLYKDGDYCKAVDGLLTKSEYPTNAYVLVRSGIKYLIVE